MSKPNIKKSKQKDIAKERIEELIKQADLTKDESLAKRYVTLARKIAMKVRLKLSPEIRRRICKHCYTLLKPGLNSITRIRDGKIIISCLKCKKFTRIPLKKK